MSRDLLAQVRAYYEACNSGDAERVAACFTPDAVHWFTRREPYRGAEEIGRWTALGVAQLGGVWTVEHGIDDGREAVIEWTMQWTDPRSGERRIDRGTEWFRFEDGRIAEVRAYHHGSPKNPSGDLVGFDHAGSGHTVLPG